MSEGRISPAPASLPDNDDLLLEILLRLPPLPSSLPRASLVCKRWRRLLSDPGFLRRFRAHHRTPPLLGFFFVDVDNGFNPAFTPTLPAPDVIPPKYSSHSSPKRVCSSSAAATGLNLLFNRRKLEAVVWDPITGRLCCIALPLELKMNDWHPNIKCDMYNGPVLRDGRSSAFKLVMILSNSMYKLACACLYDSESGKWGNIISTVVPSSTYVPQPSVLVGNALCWVLHWSGGGFLEFDMDRQSLAIIPMPEDTHVTDDSSVQVLRTEDGGLAFAILSKQRIQLWGRMTILDRVVRWALHRTIELDKLISLMPSTETRPTAMVGFDEDSNVIFLWTTIGVFMIQLESMKFMNLLKDN